MADISSKDYGGFTRWSVIMTEQVRDWLLGTDAHTYEQVRAAMVVLSEDGPSLGRPLVDTFVGSRHKNMKELRPGSGRSEIRILFAFERIRQAILLIAGDKSGDWNRWYRRNIPLADDLFDEHQKEVQGR